MQDVKRSVLADTRPGSKSGVAFSPVTERESKLIKRRARAAKVFAANVRPGLYSKTSRSGNRRSAKVRRERMAGNAIEVLFRTSDAAKKNYMEGLDRKDPYTRQAEDRTNIIERLGRSAFTRRRMARNLTRRRR